MLQRLSAFCGKYRSSGQPLAELKAPQSFWPEGVKDDEFPIRRCFFFEGYHSGSSARFDSSRFFCRCCCWEEVQALSRQGWQETDLAISDHEIHLYLDQLLYLIPSPDLLCSIAV